MGSEMCIRDSPDYNDEELLKIFGLIAGGQEYHLDEGGERAVLDFFASQDRGHGFGNGRAARNLFEASVSRHAVRMVDIPEPTDEDLVTLTSEDISGIELVDTGTEKDDQPEVATDADAGEAVAETVAEPEP